jgi:signal transduction histidine kinase
MGWMHERGIRAPERVLIVMPITAGAEQLAALLRELGTSACEIVQDLDSALRRSLALHPELVLIDAKQSSPEDAAQLAAALRPLCQAPFVYVCEPDVVPTHELVTLCSAGLEHTVTKARLMRCLIGLAHYGESERALRERALSFQGELLASMAHELRAPLQGVSGFAQYLLDGKAGVLDEVQRTCLQQIELGAEHVLQVIQDVLDLTDRDVDTLQVRSEAVDTALAVREVMQVLQALAMRRRIAVQVQVDDRLGHVVCDATKLKQVLYNLISNALKYTPSNGKLEIELMRLDADSFCLEVRDTGPGLTQPMLAHINAGASAAQTSAARGLSLTQRIVHALGGSIRAHNANPSGAVVRVELPLAPSAVNPYSRH